MVIREDLVFLGKFEGSLNGVGRTSGSQTEPGNSELRGLSGLEVRYLNILSVHPALSVVPALSEAQCITRPCFCMDCTVNQPTIGRLMG